jgi:hypothetical protein
MAVAVNELGIWDANSVILSPKCHMIDLKRTSRTLATRETATEHRRREAGAGMAVQRLENIDANPLDAESRAATTLDHALFSLAPNSRAK